MLNPDPKKYYKLQEAFDALGRKRFGDKWTGTEIRARNQELRNAEERRARDLERSEKAKRARRAPTVGGGILRQPALETVARHAGLEPHVARAAKDQVAYRTEHEARGRRDEIEDELRRILFNERVPTVLLGSNGQIIDLKGARWLDEGFLVDFQSGRVEWVKWERGQRLTCRGSVLIDRHEFDRVVLGQADRPADLPIAERPKAKATPPPSNLTDKAQSKGGSRSRHDAGLQQFIDQLFAEFKGRGVDLTPSRLKTWLENNARDQKYSAEPWIPNCDEIEFIDDWIWWIDRDGNKKKKSVRSVERYITKARDRASG